ncbi:MAG: AAA family ATPase [Desulfobacteraceae bacterium]|jgi:general secretion pathway protein A
MYNAYFGFREKPFKLVPNPDYLYLSKSHEDALAHLTYAVDQGDGFVVIVGEVGTGKTTLCRNFLEQLDNETESAYIFNPRLNSTQLMSSICNEFGIKISGKQDIKELLDKLNTYLIAQHRLDRKVILLIDEAQGLSVESLEMVRLISNLETTRSKLLQIILVGQPELEQKLGSHELRQLAQRISLNCHLEPLTASETHGYIQHRVSVAAVHPSEIFSSGACRRVFEYSGGVPRLINIICDRALLAAFSQNIPKIDDSLMKTVAAELNRRGREIIARKIPSRLIWMVVVFVVVVALSLWGYYRLLSDLFSKRAPAQSTLAMISGPQPAQLFKVPAYKVPEPAERQPNEMIEQPLLLPRAAKEPPVRRSSKLPEIIAGMTMHASRLKAMALLSGMWQKPPPRLDRLSADLTDAEFFMKAARQIGLRTFAIEDDWTLIQLVNLPAIIGFKQPETGEKIFLVLIGWRGRQIRMSADTSDKLIEIDIDQLQQYQHGPAYVLWKNILGYDFIIGQGADPNALLRVKKLLLGIGYDEIIPTPVYDSSLRRSIKDFQTRHRLKADGLVGPLTKILLIREAGDIDLPLLNQNREDGA